MMNRMKSGLIGAGLAILAFTCFAQSQRPSIVGAKIGDASYAIDTTASDGKTHSIKSLTEKGPFYLLFVKEQCSANPYATPFFQKIYEAYGDKVTFVGVINADKAGHANWKKEWKGQWTTLLDPEMKIIKGFNVKRSTPVIKIGKDGKVEKIFNGWGQASLKELSADMAKEAKVPEKDLKLDEAPNGTHYG
jgi:thiol-disulfide isomerase/thioredoxin